MSYVVYGYRIFRKNICRKIPHTEGGTLVKTFHLSFKIIESMLDIEVYKILSNALVLSNCSRNA